MYQDAVRQEIDRLGSACVDALAARLTLRSAQASLARLNELKDQAGSDHGEAPDSADRTLEFQRQTLELALSDAQAAWKNSRRVLALILNFQPHETAGLDLHG